MGLAIYSMVVTICAFAYVVWRDRARDREWEARSKTLLFHMDQVVDRALAAGGIRDRGAWSVEREPEMGNRESGTAGEDDGAMPAWMVARANGGKDPHSEPVRTLFDDELEQFGGWDDRSTG